MKTSRSYSPRSFLLMLVCLLSGLIAHQARAQTNYFHINGTSPGYGITANDNVSWEGTSWTTSASGAPTTTWPAGSFAFFNSSTTPYTVTLNNSESVAGFEQSAASVSLTIAATGSGAIDLPVGNINQPLTNAQPVVIGANVYVTAPITGSGGLFPQYISGAGGSTLYLRGTNTYQGGTLFGDGRVLTYFNNDNAFGTGTLYVYQGAGSVQPLLSEGGATITLANDWTNCNSGGGVNFASSASTPVVCNGKWDLGSYTLLLKNNGNTTAPLTINGVISGTAGLNLAGNNGGTTYLKGANTYSGKTQIQGASSGGIIVSVSSFNKVTGGSASSSLGAPTTDANGVIGLGSSTYPATLIYTGAGETTDRALDLASTTGALALQNDGTGALVFTGVNSASGAGSKTFTLKGANTDDNTIQGVIVDNTTANKTSLTKAGAGKWILAGANTYSGNTTVGAGTLALGAANAIPSGTGKGTLAVSSGATFDLAGYNCAINNFGTSAGNINNSGSADATLTIGSSGAGGTHSGVIQNTGSGKLNVTLDKCASGNTVTLSGANTYSGLTTVRNGILQIQAENNLGATPGSLVADSIILDHNLTWNAGTGANANNYYLRLVNNSVSLSATRGIYLGTSLGYGGGLGAQSGRTLTVNGPISGPGGLWIGGGTANAAIGTVALFNTANSYSGDTYIVGGTLTLGDNGVLPSGTMLTMANASGNCTFDMNGKSQTISKLTGFVTGANTPQLKLTGALTIKETANTTFNGVISGANGSLTLDASSTSTLTLMGVNTYTGPTTVNGGKLEIATAAGLASPTVTVASGAALKLDWATALSSSANLLLQSGAPSVDLNFSGTSTIHYLSFDGGATYAAPGTYGPLGSSATFQDARLTSSTGNGILSVLGAPTIDVASSANPSTYGDSVSFTASVSGSGATPTGTVTFKDGAATLGTATLDGSSQATLTLNNLSATTHSITVAYSGDVNYGSGTSSVLSQVVNRAALTVTANGLLTYGNDPSNTVYAVDYAGFQNSDTASVLTGSAELSTDATATSYVGSNYLAHVAPGTLAAANYTIVGADGVVTVTNRPLWVTNVLASDKTYDSTPAATLDFSAAGLSNLVNGDESAPGAVSLNAGSAAGAFADKHVGADKTVSITGLALAGDLGTNYVLIAPTAAASITAATLTVTATGVNKVYDGTTAVSVTLSDDRLAGDTFTVSYSSANFEDAAAGTAKAVSVSGISLSGTDAANYVLASTSASTTADITGAASSTALVSLLNPAIEGSNVTFTATVSSGAGTPSGEVVFLANGVPFSTNALVAGVASASTAALPVGTNSIAAQYATQANWLLSGDTLQQVVNSAVTYSQTNTVLGITANGNGTYTLNLLGTPGASYYVASSADVSAPAAAWSTLSYSATNAPSPSGQWSVVVSNAAPAFYRSVAVNPAP